MIINKRFVFFFTLLVILTNFLWFSTSSISFASIRFGYVPNATIGFSLIKHNKSNGFNINFNLGNNFYLKLNDNISVFAGLNTGVNGVLWQNHNTINGNNDTNNNGQHFQYIKDEYTNAQSYADEILQYMIGEANQNIKKIQDNIVLDTLPSGSLFKVENDYSPSNINYDIINNEDIILNNRLNNNIYLDTHPDDGYISWEEAIADYNNIVHDNNNEKAKFYAQLMTGLKNEPDNYSHDPYNMLQTESGKQQLYATYDRMNIVHINNNITTTISDSVLQAKRDEEIGIDSIGEIVMYDKISINEIISIIQNTENYSNIIALQDNATDGYTSWNEAKAEYGQYLEEKNRQLSDNGLEERIEYHDQDAEKYAMIMTGLMEQPTSYDEDPYVILEKERQEFSDGQNNNTLTNANQVAEKNVDKYSFRERFNFSMPIGVNVKINKKISIEPYWLVGFNVAQANAIQNNGSTRLTKVGFATGLGTRVLFCKELFFIGLEYRFAQNMFEKTKIQSHNINLSMGVRFNLATLSNLIQ